MATHTLRLTDEQLNVINAGLQEVALKHAAPVIATINHQLALERENTGETGPKMGVVEGRADGTIDVTLNDNIAAE